MSFGCFMSNPVFSIIVPVYNVAEYVQKCLASLANQTLKEIEVIVIDDGSTDSSLSICQEFAKSRPNFRVFSKENEGQGVARNLGLLKSQGEFICFVDSDDWVDSTLCEDLLAVMESTDADFANFGLEFFGDSGRVLKKFSRFRSFEILNDEIFRHALLDDQVLSAVCNKVYRREFLINHGVLFPALRANEDIYFSRAVALWANKAVFVSNVYYHALVRRDSTTRNMGVKNFEATRALLDFERSKFFFCNRNCKFENLFQAHVVKLLSSLLVQAAFRIKDYDEYVLCFEVARECGYFVFLNNRDAVGCLKLRNKIVANLCLYPRMVRLLARVSNFIGVRPY